MSDELDGLLSQDDIDAALSEASAPSDSSEKKEEPAKPAEAAEAAAPADAPVDTRVDSTGRPFDAVAAAMAEAIEAEKSATAASEPPEYTPPPPPPKGSKPLDLPQLNAAAMDPKGSLQAIELLRDVDLNVKIELGRSRMLVDDVLELGEGAVVELDKLAGDPVDVFVNNRLVAKGEVLVLNDSFCVRISDIISRELDGEEEEEA